MVEKKKKKRMEKKKMPLTRLKSQWKYTYIFQTVKCIVEERVECYTYNGKNVSTTNAVVKRKKKKNCVETKRYLTLSVGVLTRRCSIVTQK